MVQHREGLRRPAWEIPIVEVIESKSIGNHLVCQQCEMPALNRGGLLLETTIDSTGPERRTFKIRFPSPLNWFDWDGLQMRIRAQCSDPKAMVVLRAIVNEEQAMKVTVPPVKHGDDRILIARFPIDGRETLQCVSSLSFFLLSKNYANRTRISLDMSDFCLVKLRETIAQLPAGEVGLELVVGDGTRVAVVERVRRQQKLQDAMLSIVAHLHAGPACTLRPTDTITCVAEDLFTGRKISFEQLLGRELNGPAKLEYPLVIPMLPPGYYWMTCDLVRDGESLAGGRVGFADCYVMAENESMTHAILSLRTGMGLYIIDPVGGYGSGSIVLMPTYDPRDHEHYLDFIRAYIQWSPKGASTAKDTEVLEAGVTATVFAATAFREAGEVERQQFAEQLLKSNLDYMLNYMQHPDGSTPWTVNEYLWRNIGEYDDGEPTEVRVPDTNQVGEWLRAVARSILYFRDVPGEQDYVNKLYKAGLKSAEFIVETATDEIDDLKHVIRHFWIMDDSDMSKRWLYHEDHRQCDVYLPRAMAGLSYFAYVRQLRDSNVPQSWLDALRDTTEWCLRKMTPEGWFDWQCPREVEGGCHSFLGNLYLAEATQGYYLLSAARGDLACAKLAANCTTKALHFLTDHDWFVSKHEGPFEFWVGPYLYWQFTEYLGSIGEDPKLRSFLDKLHRAWAEESQWRDFTQRHGRSPLFRANQLCHIHQSIIAYPALRYLEDIGRPFRYPVPSLDALSAAATG